MDNKTIINKIKEEVGKVIVGQSELIEKIIIALLCKGHILIEGNPGLGKTLLVSAFSRSIGCGECGRLQFTPDLLPADIIGTMLWNPKDEKFFEEFGPITKHSFIIVDEINRAPPKVHSALLEVMQEGKVSLVGSNRKEFVKRPFMVLATQNPLESEGVYELPLAQIDRFMFKLRISYPSSDDEIKIIELYTDDREDYNKFLEKISPIDVKEILKMQESIKTIEVSPDIKKYAQKIVEATRDPKKYKLDSAEIIGVGVSTRAFIDIIFAAKAKALIENRSKVESDDIDYIVKDVLRHRIILNSIDVDIKNEEDAKEKLIGDILNKVEF